MDDAATKVTVLRREYRQSDEQPGFRAENEKCAISGHFLLVFLCLSQKR